MTTQQAEDKLVATILASIKGRAFQSLPSGAQSVEGEDGVSLFRFMTLVSGLRLEVRCPGLRLSRGVNCWKMAKAEFGLKGARPKVLAELEALHERAKARAEAALQGEGVTS